MTYALPAGAGAAPMAAGASLVSARVSRNLTTDDSSGEWVVQGDLGNTDTSFGPVNMLLG
jgi:hypothetical protein